MKKKLTQTQKKAKLDKEILKLWKEACLEYYGDTCEYCGQPLSTFHHFIPKSRSLLLRYDIKNAIPLCMKCHYNIHFSSKPTVTADIVNTIRKNRGKEWNDYINEKEKISISRTIKWLNEQLEKFK